jgi:hypothetical protein
MYGFLFSVPPLDHSGSGTAGMPGIRFAAVRAKVTIAEALSLLGFVACKTSEDHVLCQE